MIGKDQVFELMIERIISPNAQTRGMYFGKRGILPSILKTQKPLNLVIVTIELNASLQTQNF